MIFCTRMERDTKFVSLLDSRGGEIGRRAGFKIQYPSGCVGSSPTLGTF